MKRSSKKMAAEKEFITAEPLRAVIISIYEHGCYSNAGRDAIAELAKGGKTALETFLKSSHLASSSTLHPRDLQDTYVSVLGEFARQNPQLLIDQLESGTDSEIDIYWALGCATDVRSIDVLIAGLQSKEMWARWSAAESLIRRNCERAAEPLLQRLKDRSEFVKSSIVQAMLANSWLRHPQALPLLERLVASKSIQKNSPGTAQSASRLIELIKNEAP